LTNGGACTRYEFAARIFALAGVKADLRPISSARYGAKAARPAYSVLDCGKYHALGLPPLREWPDALQEYLLSRGRASSAG
jgi:dTDP-4-dehydrorhamnose reductase